MLHIALSVQPQVSDRLGVHYIREMAGSDRRLGAAYRPRPVLNARGRAVTRVIYLFAAAGVLAIEQAAWVCPGKPFRQPERWLLQVVTSLHDEAPHLGLV